MTQTHINCGCGDGGASSSSASGKREGLPIHSAKESPARGAASGMIDGGVTGAAGEGHALNPEGQYPNPLVDAVEVHADGRPGGYGNNSFCEKIFDELNDLLESPCNETRRRAIMDAVNSCPQCFEAYGIEQAVRDLLKQCCCEPAPETLRTKIRVVIDRVHIEER